MTVKIYIEGGGDGSALDSVFRSGWAKFFSRAGLGSLPRVVRGKGRADTVDRFLHAVKTDARNEVSLLLVDSETIPESGSVADHLRRQDSWKPPKGIREDSLFLMVCTMETWVVADRAGLADFFGAGFRDSAIPKWGNNLESIPKHRILDALKRATARCGKRYEKGQISFRALEALDSRVIESSCPAAKRLLDRLRQLSRS